MVPPGFSSPDASAASTIRSAIRSFTDPPGLRYSTLASTVRRRCPRSPRPSLTRGVSPTRSTMCSANFIRLILSRPGCRPAPSVGEDPVERRRRPCPIGDDGRHGRLPRGEPAQLGRARRRARRQRRVRVRPLRHRPRAPQRRRALRPAAARRRDRADRHPPAVPHRHRHPVAGPARGADDRPRPVAGVAGAGASARDATPARTSTTSRPTPTPAPRGARRTHLRPRLHRHRRAVLAARHRPLGRRRRRRCSSPAGGCSCAKDTR